MKNKKVIIAKFFCVLALCLIAGAGVYAENLNVDSQRGPVHKKITQSISKAKVFDGSIVAEEVIECFPEEKYRSGDKEVYKKRIAILKTFKKYSEGVVKPKSKYLLDVTFTYDKKSFVKIENEARDVKFEKQLDKWKIMNLSEIFPGEKVCVVSGKYVLSKESSLRSDSYVCGTHADIFCSTIGEIGVNTEMH